MSDFAFLDNMPDPRIERITRDRQRRGDMLREFAHQKLKHLQNDAEQAQDYCRTMIQAGFDVSDELKEMETFSNGLLLATLLMKREAERSV